VGVLRHLFILAVIGVVFRWLWKSSLNEHASVESGRMLFPPTRAIRILVIFLGIAFTNFFIWSWFAVRKPDRDVDVQNHRSAVRGSRNLRRITPRPFDPLACAALDIKLDPDRNMIAGVDLATHPSVDSAVDEVFG